MGFSDAGTSPAAGNISDGGVRPPSCKRLSPQHGCGVAPGPVDPGERCSGDDRYETAGQGSGKSSTVLLIGVDFESDGRRTYASKNKNNRGRQLPRAFLAGREYIGPGPARRRDGGDEDAG